MSFRKPVRELYALEIIDRSFSLYIQRLLEFFAPFLFVGIVNGVIRYAMGSFLPTPVLPQGTTEQIFQWLMSNLWVFVGAASTSGIIFWIVTTIANGIAVKYASDLLERGDANLATAFSFTVYRLAPLLVAGLISGVLTILGFICFIVPGVIVAIMFSLIVPVIIIEDRGALESLERSRRLVRKSWWKTFAILLIVLFVTGLLSIIGESISGFFGPFGDVASTLIAAFIQPIHPLASTYLYYSMRIKEARLAPPVTYRPPIAPAPTTQRPTILERPIFCIHCGQKLPADAVFCPNCGNKVAKSS